MLKLSIKASQITNLTDARYFAAREVEWLGFNLDSGSETAIPPQNVAAIKEWVEGPFIVGEFGLQSPEDIKTAVEYLGLDAVQVGMFADTNVIASILDIPVLKEVVIENENLGGLEEMIQSQATIVHAFVLDFVKNNIPWTDLSKDSQALLKVLCQENKILFNLNLSLEELPEFIESIQPYGLILEGDEEEKVGFKSFDHLDDILDFLEVEEEAEEK